MSQPYSATAVKPKKDFSFVTPLFLSIVIPAYNEAKNIESITEQLNQVTGQCSDVKNYEIIVVDDHSSDQTFEAVKSLKNPKIYCIRLSRRSGSHTALRAGISVARGDLALSISADGQDDAGILNDMIAKLKTGCQVVWGVRKKRDEPFLTKVLTTCAYKLIVAFSGADSSEINLSNADFFILSRKVIDAINSCQERNTSFWGLLFWLGFKQGYVEYDRKSRRTGKSKWSIRSKVRLFLDWIIAFSGVPLRLISLVGFITATSGFLYATFIVLYALLGYARPGWAETVILILVLGGIQMMMLGILGEYLWRTLDETRRRPLFFIEDRTIDSDDVDR